MSEREALEAARARLTRLFGNPVDVDWDALLDAVLLERLEQASKANLNCLHVDGSPDEAAFRDLGYNFGFLHQMSLTALREKDEEIAHWGNAASTEGKRANAAEQRIRDLEADARRWQKMRELWFLLGTMRNLHTRLGRAIHAIQAAGDVETLDAAVDAAIDAEAK